MMTVVTVAKAVNCMPLAYSSVHVEIMNSCSVALCGVER